MLFEDLKPLTLEDAELYTHYFEKSQTETADACPNSRFAWNCGYEYRRIVLEDCLCLVSDGSIFYSPHFALPLGELNQEKMNRIIEYMRRLFAEKNWPLRSLFIDEQYKPLYDGVPGLNPEWVLDEGLSDYLYNAEDLRRLRGKAYRTKRNHINQFVRAFPAFSYRPIRKEDKEACVTLVSEWCQERGIDCSDPLESDCLPISRLFDAMDVLDVRGGLIEMDEQVVAFAMGSLVHGNRAVVHFEKARPDYDGAYTIINKLVLMEAFPEALEVNREEDMGIDGLREAKQSYLPTRLIRKYEMAAGH